MYRWVLQLDVRRILPAIRVPTLILHRQENTHYRLAYGRYLAEHIPDAKFIELPDADCYPFYAGNSDPILDEIQEFLTGRRERPEHDRTLATVLFTDIAGSTEQAARVGDAKWLNLRESHNVIIRQLLRQWRGQEVQTTGDGFLATFDGPARAIRCAADIVQSVRSLGLEVRAGLHTGEVELHDGHVAGIAVHIAARVMAATAAGHVLVSGTVKDLVVGSGIEFTDAGAHTLKGVPGEWRLFEVARLP
jgi:class 3 adenylate cyclase